MIFPCFLVRTNTLLMVSLRGQSYPLWHPLIQVHRNGNCCILQTMRLPLGKGKIVSLSNKLFLYLLMRTYESYFVGVGPCWLILQDRSWDVVKISVAEVPVLCPIYPLLDSVQHYHLSCHLACFSEQENLQQEWWEGAGLPAGTPNSVLNCCCLFHKEEPLSALPCNRIAL